MRTVLNLSRESEYFLVHFLITFWASIGRSGYEQDICSNFFSILE